MMNYEIQKFQNDLFGLSVVTDTRTGEEWFELAEVCRCLGVKNSRDVKKRVDEEDAKMIKLPVDSIDTNTSPTRERTYVNESGIYSIALSVRSSDKATPFKRWVTKEVLPSIRKTGKYEMARPNSENEKAALVVLESWLGAAKLLEVPKHIAQTEAIKVTRERTNVDFTQLLLKAPAQKDINEKEMMLEVTELGALVGVSGRKVNSFFAGIGYQVREGKSWRPTAKARHGIDWEWNRWLKKGGTKAGYNVIWNKDLFLALWNEHHKGTKK
jgi:prophage antirepressor-like protein